VGRRTRENSSELAGTDAEEALERAITMYLLRKTRGRGRVFQGELNGVREGG